MISINTAYRVNNVREMYLTCNNELATKTITSCSNNNMNVL